MSLLVKTCEGCGLDFRRPTGTSKINDERWLARRFCTARCGLHAAGASSDGKSHGNQFNATGADVHASNASAALLVRLIQYGLKHDSDLGMGYEPFMARARELRLAA